MKQKKKVLRFPQGFLWGAATSAHQIEGGNRNDWSEWEKKNAKRLAREAKMRWEKCEAKKTCLPAGRFPEMFDPKNYISGKACDHYNRFEEDFDTAKSLGLTAFRISLEWSRIEPEEGKFDDKEIGHYRKVIEAIRTRGMEPFVTLCHYTLPLWFSRKGGWESKNSPQYFESYAKKVAEEYKDLVKFWITFNETILLVGGEYIKGYRPPQKRNLLIAFKVWKNIVQAHIKSYNVIHSANPHAQVGYSEWLNFFDNRRAFFKTNLLLKTAKYFANEFILDRIAEYLDFIGAQYYMQIPFSLPAITKKAVYQTSDTGWPLVPKGMYFVLQDLKKYKLPIYITENGIADSEDKFRSSFIKDNLKEVHQAIQEGIDIRGYFYWSFIDNFEWQEGFWPRFGLVEIDYKTMKRTIRPSAWEYAKICKSNSLIL